LDVSPLKDGALFEVGAGMALMPFSAFDIARAGVCEVLVRELCGVDGTVGVAGLVGCGELACVRMVDVGKMAGRRVGGDCGARLNTLFSVTGDRGEARCRVESIS
jgi:hypothetical protein